MNREPQFNWRYLFLLALPIAVYLAVYLIIDPARPAGLLFAIIDADKFQSVAAVEGQHRYLWLRAFSLLTAAALAIAVSACLTVWRWTPPALHLGVFGLMAVVFVSVAILELAGCFKEWHTYLGHGLFDEIFNGGRPSGTGDRACSALAGDFLASILRGVGFWKSGTPMELFLTGQKIIKVSSLAAVVGLATGLVMTQAKPAAEAKREHRAQFLLAALDQQKAFLSQAVLLYVLAVLAVAAWMFWPLPYLTSSAAEQYTNLATGALLLNGVAFSIGVGAFYLPPAMLLRHRAALLAREIAVERAKPASKPDSEAPADTMLTALAFNPFDQLRQAFAIILPALVSLLPSLPSFVSTVTGL